jgi:hypothetical protein
LTVAIISAALVGSGMAQTPASRIDEALQNVTTLVRPGKVGYATIWDGNKYVQCRRLPDRAFREAAGTSMQSSLQNVLLPERQNRLKALGWVLDPSFGNYVQIFAADAATSLIAEQILQTLTEGYDANAGTRIQHGVGRRRPLPAAQRPVAKSRRHGQRRARDARDGGARLLLHTQPADAANRRYRPGPDRRLRRDRGGRNPATAAEQHA